MRKKKKRRGRDRLYGRSVGDACFEYGSRFSDRESHQLKDGEVSSSREKPGNIEIYTKEVDNSPNL